MKIDNDSSERDLYTLETIPWVNKSCRHHWTCSRGYR